MAFQGAVNNPDTLIEESRNGPMPFYGVQLKVDTTQTRLGRSREIQIVAGMTAMVEIKAKNRTVLSYLTKPITKVLAESMGER